MKDYRYRSEYKSEHFSYHFKSAFFIFMNERIFLFLSAKAEKFCLSSLYKSKINCKKGAKVLGSFGQNFKKQAKVLGSFGQSFGKLTKASYFFTLFLAKIKTLISEISTQNPKIAPNFFKNSN
jgi:hypothetical protein